MSSLYRTWSRDSRVPGPITTGSLLASACFETDFDSEKGIEDALRHLESRQLGSATSLYVLRAAEDNTEVRETIVDDSQATVFLSSRDKLPGTELLAVSKACLTAPQDDEGSSVGGDPGRLLISQQVLRLMVLTYKVPVAFLTAIMRPSIVCTTGFRRVTPHSWAHWCLIPIRTVTPCQVQDNNHAKCGVGSKKTDPCEYIHLSGVEVDIRGSYIGLFIRHNSETRRTTVITISLLDRGLRNFIEEPLARAKVALKQRPQTGSVANPLCIHMVYISSALGWWNDVLLCFNQQIVQHEQQLQHEIVAQTSAFSEESKEMNTSLHVMAAHLHRCQSDLRRIDGLLSELMSPKFKNGETADSQSNVPSSTEISWDGINTEHLRWQLTTIMNFSDELERKIQNILTLLFNQIQVTNGKAMQAILKAAQEDNRISQQIAFQSHLLTQSMKNDSVAMKTIAVLTMLFLPGTSFAAILSMPFFDGSPYLSNPARAWIWAVFTAVATLMAFGVFFHVIKQQKRVLEYDGKDGDRREELSGLEAVSLSSHSRLSATRTAKEGSG